MTIRRKRLLIPLAVSCLLVTGCASTPTHAASSASSKPAFQSARYTAGLPAQLDLTGTGISLSPLLSAVVPPISGPQAFETCVTGASLCDPALTPDVYLALADKPDSNMSKQLVWVIDYPGSTCVPYGHAPALSTDPASPGSSTESSPGSYPCRLVDLIDSGTGHVLWSVRVPQ